MRSPIRIALLAACLCMPAASAGHGPGHHHGRHCRDCSAGGVGCADGCNGCLDRVGLATAAGTVAEIAYLPGGIVEAKLDTVGGPEWVRLASASFLKRNGFPVKEGDAISAAGYRVEGMDGPLLVATEVRMADKRLTIPAQRGRRSW